MAEERDEELADLDDEIITCWCGVKGTADELFDDDFLEDGCGGTGELQCFCGGDQCVCHNHGSIPCEGCEDCDGDGGDDDDWDDDDYGDEK